MEKARSYWATIGRRRFGEMPFFGAQIPSLAAVRSAPFEESSWEEQAFAKDSAGHLGGCVWPPRSYSCSFCRREFRSAQALGGHMNVHRKDRAMLKQCSSPGAAAAAGDQTLDITHLGSPAREVQYSGSTTANPNPNSASSISPRVSASVAAQEWSLPIRSTSCLYSSSSIIVREKLKEYSIVSTAAAPTTLQLFAVPESGLNKARYLEQIGGGNILGTRKAKFQTVGDEGEEEDENKECNKRRRIESKERRSAQDDQNEALHEEELDLELRLGDHISQVK